MPILTNFLKNKELDDVGLKKLFRLYNSKKGNAEIKKLMDKSWPVFRDDDCPEIDSVKIYAEINTAIYNRQLLKDRKIKLFYQWTTAVAAALVIGLLIAATFFLDIRIKNNLITPLTEVVAPQGKITNCILPDDTKVWLNPGSSLVYSENMTNDKIRDVRLWGQAFFEVAKDKKHPFILQLGDIGLKVTGTSFNASNYKDDLHIDVVLKTGHVSLFRGTYTSDADFVNLNPEEMVKYEKRKNKFIIQHVDVQKYISWKDGILMFRDDRMSEVFRRLERWYNVKIIVGDPQINNYLYTATIKNENLEQILKLLGYTSRLKCEMIVNDHNQASKPTFLINKNTN